MLLVRHIMELIRHIMLWVGHRKWVNKFRAHIGLWVEHKLVRHIGVVRMFLRIVHTGVV
jgi:hypothetical protein